mmetsp:Transcript_38793/g.76448  ORF Transcript_38793/g.76448 Transcript_38793/m.76448 type:complete len:123 (+) Transcript_38793:848-1216(+)
MEYLMQAEAFLRQPSSGYSSWHFLESHFLYDEEGSLYSSSLFEDADLRTTTSTHAALAVDPRTGEEVFFNQVCVAIDHFYVSRLHFAFVYFIFCAARGGVHRLVRCAQRARVFGHFWVARKQ